MQGKTAMVTGATSGMGLATAEALARLGAAVILVGRDPVRGAGALQRIKAGGGDPAVDFFQADLSSQQQVRRVAGEFVARYPRLEVLVNNAGVFLSSDAHRQAAIAWDDLQGSKRYRGFQAYSRAKLANVVFGKSPEEGAETAIYLATSPEVEGITGTYWAKKMPKESLPRSYHAGDAWRLWNVSQELTGLRLTGLRRLRG